MSLVRKREAMGDDPPFLSVGTEVSAKYKGAFCEAKIRKVVKTVKCKVLLKHGLGTVTVTDDQIKGPFRVGSQVEVRHGDKKEFVEASISKIQDCSQYTVVFDDGDITTLRRSALCLKSGRHFAESETLDQLPLTHPEHFFSPTVGRRRRRRAAGEESSDEESSFPRGSGRSFFREEREADIGKVICVEVSDKKKLKDNWFPGLIVAPTAQDTVRIHVKNEYLVRSFKDGRYYTVQKKGATEFTKEIGEKVENHTLKVAVEKALLFMDQEELPPHWDRDILFGLAEPFFSDMDGLDSDFSDDEPREEKDHFVAQLYKFMDDRGTPINRAPTIASKDVDLYRLFKVGHNLGGFNKVTNHNHWRTVSVKLGFGSNPNVVNSVKLAYRRFLLSFEEFYKKLGCTMVNHPRISRNKQKTGRSLIREREKSNCLNYIKVEKVCEEGSSSGAGDSCPPPLLKAECEGVVSIVGDPCGDPNEVPSPLEKQKGPDSCDSSDGFGAFALSQVKSQVKREVLPVKVEREEEPPLPDLVDGDSKTEIKHTRSKSRERTVQNKSFSVSKKKEDKKLIGKKARLDKSNPSKLSGKPPFVKREDRPPRLTLKPVVPIRKDRPPRLSLRVPALGLPKDRPPRLSLNPKLPSSPEPPKESRPARRLSLTKSKNNLPVKSKPKAAPPLKSVGAKSKVAIRRPSKETRTSQSEDTSARPSMITRQGRTLTPRFKALLEAKKSKPTKDVTPLGNEAGKNKSTLAAKVKEEVGHPKCKKEKKLAASSLEKKKGGRKKKEKRFGREDSLDILPNYKTVLLGDKLKVYYGQEMKIYEAKVLNIRGDGQEVHYYVHYLGWNIRYDEWIKSGRIVDNLSWVPGRTIRKVVESPKIAKKKSIDKTPPPILKPKIVPAAKATLKSAKRDSLLSGSEEESTSNFSIQAKKEDFQSYQKDLWSDNAIDGFSDKKVLVKVEGEEVVVNQLASGESTEIGDSKSLHSGIVDAEKSSDTSSIGTMITIDIKKENELDEIREVSEGEEIKQGIEIDKVTEESEDNKIKIASEAAELEEEEGMKIEIEITVPRNEDFEEQNKEKEGEEIIEEDIVVPDDDFSQERKESLEEDGWQEEKLASRSDSKEGLVPSEDSQQELSQSADKSRGGEEMEDVYEFKEPEPCELKYEFEVRKSEEKNRLQRRSRIFDFPSSDDGGMKRNFTYLPDFKAEFPKESLKEDEEVIVEEVSPISTDCVQEEVVTSGGAEEKFGICSAESLSFEEKEQPLVSERDTDDETDSAGTGEFETVVSETIVLGSESKNSHSFENKLDSPKYELCDEDDLQDEVLNNAIKRAMEEELSEGSNENSPIPCSIKTASSEDEETDGDIEIDMQKIEEPSSPKINLDLEEMKSSPFTLGRVEEVITEGKPEEIESDVAAEVELGQDDEIQQPSMCYYFSEEEAIKIPLGSADQAMEVATTEDSLPPPDLTITPEATIVSLLCEESIPGSPAPIDCQVEQEEKFERKEFSDNDSAPSDTVENIVTVEVTHPYVEEKENSSGFNLGSPISAGSFGKGERSNSSLVNENETTKSHREPEPETELTTQTKEEEEDDISLKDRLNAEKPAPTKKPKKRKKQQTEDTSKRKRSRKEVVSDSDDTSENSNLVGRVDERHPSKSPRPFKYNFNLQLGSDLDSNQRVLVLRNTLQDMRSVYSSLKNSLATIDRRRKKLRRREREMLAASKNK